MIQLRANPGPTGRLLGSLLQAKGLLEGEVKGVVNYGYGGPSPLPTLNRRAGTFNKLQELEMLKEKGVATIPFHQGHAELSLPVLGRNLQHSKGSDIVVYQVHPGVVPTRIPHDFFTQLIPKSAEYRVWSYRRIPIGVYEKVLTYPNKLGRRGRSREIWNRRNGYGFFFRKSEDLDAELRTLGASAVDGVGLDFGAADVIRGRDGKYYVLEVNSAPGVEGPRQCMQSLVNHIAKWAAGGFKKRNGEE